MNLLNQFEKLQQPSKGKNVFNAETLYTFPFAKVGINNLGYPIILIESKPDGTFLNHKNIRLKYLELSHNLECKITENNKSKTANFSVIKFDSDEVILQNYFFNIVENLLKELSKNPSQKEIFETFKGFIEVFRTLSNSPNSTIQGLWSELFVIESSKNIETLVNYWHNRPEEKIDFNADLEKIEVKSSSNLERVHFFTSEQLDVEDGKLLIASVYTKQTTKGKNIADLMDSIKNSLNEDTLIEKLYSIVSKTLGSSLEQGLKIKFDYEIAKSSLRYYDSKTISKIENVNIPDKVSDVKYKSDLTNVTPVDIYKIKCDGILFKGL